MITAAADLTNEVAVAVEHDVLLVHDVLLLPRVHDVLFLQLLQRERALSVVTNLNLQRSKRNKL